MGLNSELGGAIGNTAVAFMYAKSQVAEREAQHARSQAAYNRARAGVLSTSVEQLRSDVILAEAEVRSLQEELDDMKDELAAEAKRTALLMGCFIDLQDPNLTPEARQTVILESLAALRQTAV